MSSTYTATRRLYKDKDGNIVEASDPKRATLFATPGKQISVTETDAAALAELDKPAPEPEKPATEQKKASGK